jgi:hypothetical protein
MMPRTPEQRHTMKVLDMVFEERQRQNAKHGDAMLHLPDGTGPGVQWLHPLCGAPANDIQSILRDEYTGRRGAENPEGQYGQLTKMHLVREEIAEAFELHGDDPEFVTEILQVAALCVQWAEYKLA